MPCDALSCSFAASLSTKSAFNSVFYSTIFSTSAAILFISLVIMDDDAPMPSAKYDWEDVVMPLT